MSPGISLKQKAQKIPLNRAQWTILILLVLSITINYIDRGALSAADKYLQFDFGLDTEKRGTVYSAFFMGYAGFMLLAGWLVDRFDVNRVLAFGFLVWTTAILLTGAASSFPMLIGLRLLLGAGESVAYPAYSRILAADFREEQRGFANAAIDAGSKMGPALSLLLGGLLMEKYGWRSFFYAMGVLSLLWMIPWLTLVPKTKHAVATEVRRIPSMLEICRKRAAWGTFMGLFGGNYAWYFLLTWIPGYFRSARGYTQAQVATLGSIPLWVIGITTLLSGLLSDRLIARGWNASKVRKGFLATGLITATIMLPAAIVQDSTQALVLICIASVGIGIESSNVWATTQRMAGPLASGRWTGMQNLAGNIPGIIAPWFTGWVAKVSGGSFYAAFVAATAMLLVGFVGYIIVIPCVEPIDWDAEK
ncbi:MAG TPA: MFS transporter [Bryobacteraceae bacterium]|nr:MFS transporter [Bryobacteraceae bacterium]